MDNNQRKILEMLADKKISVDEAERLMEAVRTGEETGETASPTAEPTRVIKGLPKYLRVVVRPGENASPKEAETVNIRVPIALVRAGMKLTAVIPPIVYSRMDSALKEKGIDFDLKNIKPEDIEELVQALGDTEIDIQDGKQTVKVYAE